MYYLIRKNPDGTLAERWRLGDQTLIVGRSERANARVLSAEVSRTHFQIAQQGEGNFVLRDLQSRNGTWVNGERVEEVRLKPGDRIQVGHVTMEYLVERPIGLRPPRQ